MHQEFNPYAKYLKYRRKTVRDLFDISERFGFKNETVHHAVAIFDKMLQIENSIDKLRDNYESCKGVITEQICTFIGAVSLFMSAKYIEIKYPVVEDVCNLMKCPFSFQEFVQME